MNMKFHILLIASLAISVSATSNIIDLINELQEFADVLPTPEILNIYYEYLTTDEEVQAMVRFQYSDDFKEYILRMEAIPEYKELLRFVQDSGIDVYTYMEFLHRALDLPPFVPPSYTKSNRKTGTGLRGMYDDMAKIIPWDQIRNLSVEKYDRNTMYTKYYDMLNSPRYKQKFCQLMQSQDFQDLLQYALQFGFDTILINEFNLRVYNIEITHC